MYKKVLKYIFSSLCFLPAVWATEMSRIVEQPIRAELNIIINDPSKYANNRPFHSSEKS